MIYRDKRECGGQREESVAIRATWGILVFIETLVYWLYQCQYPGLWYYPRVFQVCYHGKTLGWVHTKSVCIISSTTCTYKSTIISKENV